MSEGRSESVDAAHERTIAAMVAEVERGPEIYRPSRFWEHLNCVNKGMLQELGLENFKRSVAQNYFNWLVLGRGDPQFRAASGRWLRRPSLQPFLNKLEVPELLRTTAGPEDNIRPMSLWIYKLFVGMLWEYALQQDWSGISGRVEEPEIGNPIRLYRRGKLITQDLANSIREYNAILGAARDLAESPKRVAELGAGYGRVAHVFLSDQRTKYFIFDIPPALHVAQWYLGEAHPARRAFRFRHFDAFGEVAAELEACDVAFLTPNQMALFPDGYFDIFATISTLPEMAAEQIENYLRQIERLSKRFVYLKQWLDWENPADGHRVVSDSMRLGSGWTPVYDRPDAIQPLFFERLWRKN